MAPPSHPQQLLEVSILQVRIEQLAKQLATRRVGLAAGQGEGYRLWMRAKASPEGAVAGSVKPPADGAHAL